MNRKINLGKFGIKFESIDIGVEGCDSKEEATNEIGIWHREIIEAFKQMQEKQKVQEEPF